MSKAAGDFRYDVLDGITEDGDVKDRHGIEPMGVENICHRYTAERNDAPTRMISMAVIPELKYFSAIPVALRPSQTTLVAPTAKRTLASSSEMPKNSLKILPQPLV